MASVTTYGIKLRTYDYSGVFRVYFYAAFDSRSVLELTMSTDIGSISVPCVKSSIRNSVLLSCLRLAFSQCFLL